MTLYLVATPIGNLKDISYRAVETLAAVDFILAEDTRHSKILLDHYAISKPMFSFHSHSKDAAIEKYLERLEKGEQAALISDAGTPGISDPAWALTSACVARGIPLVPIPGASAFLTALMGSGLPMDKFHYYGFIPAKKGRKTLFESLREVEHTCVMYESPHRIVKTLEMMKEILGEGREVVLARELTKKFESFERASLGELYQKFEKTGVKGEIVLLISPRSR